MHIRTAFLLLALSVAFVGCGDRAPRSGGLSSELPHIRTGYYRPDPYIQAAIELQSLGRANALAQLHSMAQDSDLDSRVIVLCRMLFVPRPGSEFRGPGFGRVMFIGGTDYPDWPLEPIELVDGVPFKVIWGWRLAGMAESDEGYLRYCETNCDWSPFRYSTKSESQKLDALKKLLESSKWKVPLDTYEREIITRQIE